MQKILQKTFLELIALDGVYPNEDRVIEYVERRLAAAGIPFARDDFGNIIIRISGRGEPVMLSTHLDIPEPAPSVRYVIEGSIIRSDGSGILGADPKSGLAVLLELMPELTRTPERHAPVEIVLTRGEEVGLLGARNLDYSLIKSKIGLVLDEDGPVTQVVTKAPAYVRLDAEFTGKIVHPREPEKGINALEVACNAMTKIPWGYSAPGVTWNIGLFDAGSARNSVPGRARLRGELRSYDAARAMAEAARIDAAYRDTAAIHDARCVIDRELEFDGYELTRAHPLFARLERTFDELGLTPNYFSTYGGSDANIFNANGITAVPIGSAYYNAHEYTEYVDLAEMERIFQFLKRFVSAEAAIEPSPSHVAAS